MEVPITCRPQKRRCGAHFDLFHPTCLGDVPKFTATYSPQHRWLKMVEEEMGKTYLYIIYTYYIIYIYIYMLTNMYMSLCSSTIFNQLDILFFVIFLGPCDFQIQPSGVQVTQAMIGQKGLATFHMASKIHLAHIRGENMSMS